MIQRVVVVLGVVALVAVFAFLIAPGRDAVPVALPSAATDGLERDEPDSTVELAPGVPIDDRGVASADVVDAERPSEPSSRVALGTDETRRRWSDLVRPIALEEAGGLDAVGLAEATIEILLRDGTGSSFVVDDFVDEELLRSGRLAVLRAPNRCPRMLRVEDLREIEGAVQPVSMAPGARLELRREGPSNLETTVVKFHFAALRNERNRERMVKVDRRTRQALELMRAVLDGAAPVGDRKDAIFRLRSGSRYEDYVRLDGPPATDAYLSIEVEFTDATPVPIDGLPLVAGKSYRAEIEADGLAELRGSELDGSYGRSADVALVSAGETVRLGIAFDGAGTLVGEIPADVEGATLELWLLDPLEDEFVRSGADRELAPGPFTIAGLAPGSWAVRATLYGAAKSPDGADGEPPAGECRAYIERRFELERRAIHNVGLLEPVDDAALTVVPRLRVDAKVPPGLRTQLFEGLGSIGVIVESVDDLAAPARALRLAVDGTTLRPATLRGLAPGHYRVHVGTRRTKDDFVPTVAEVGLHWERLHEVHVRPDERTELEVEFAFQVPTRVTVSARLPDGTIRPDVVAWAFDSTTNAVIVANEWRTALIGTRGKGAALTAVSEPESTQLVLPDGEWTVLVQTWEGFVDDFIGTATWSSNTKVLPGPDGTWPSADVVVNVGPSAAATLGPRDGWFAAPPWLESGRAELHGSIVPIGWPADMAEAFTPSTGRSATLARRLLPRTRYRLLGSDVEFETGPPDSRVDVER
ncbi:hypothetical protein Pla163_03340 [Planctomycetes bacterium Pla163]|uniref:Uncharacterized protein n=1 Tax=Rohdeia mirabilis TaxID=2528008 RepID=A0A518CVI8_9BACT|nr:hypothetical protein Pla163_03340 [Planctomycetes bacterium Pla163]